MFITFEGIEGSGKGTVIAGVREWLRSLPQGGPPLFCTREPGGSDLGRELRALLLDARRSIAPEAELFLYLADRAQHVRGHIRPALDAGTVVISDRYADSTIVYQGYGRGLDVEELFRLNVMAVGGLWPDLTLLMDLPPQTGLARARARNLREGLEVAEGRFEAENLAFHQRVRDGYLAWAGRHPGRFRIVDAAAPPKDVLASVKAALAEAFGLG